ncbi:MAG: FecR domain-containing protein, partial [Verrucomicrobiales bacterium]|nr:FecR domain-containing protein [Verrucomicrobiales bacterium]
MNRLLPTPRRVRAVLLGFGLLVFWGFGNPARGAERVPEARVLEVRGAVEFLQAGSATWYLVATNQVLYEGDALRTGARSSATLLLTNRSIVPVPALTTLRFKERPTSLAIEVLKGVLYLFHRGVPGDFEVEGRGVTAAVRGTEFAFEVRPDGEVVTTVIDGDVALTDATGAVLAMTSGDIATAPPGARAVKSATWMAGDWTPVQWALQYPAVLDPRDLGWERPPDPALESSWTAFVRGDLPRALADYPLDRQPARDDERVYLAALLLSAGEVSEASALLARIDAASEFGPLASAHRRLVDGVVRGPGGRSGDAPASEGTATALLVESYRLQGVARLVDARNAAREAAERSPGCGWAWVRLAELEFGLGRRGEAEAALERGVERQPDNAQARVLRGFLAAARNRIPEARAAFEDAMARDGRLGGAWLGRGLCRIREGDLAGGREDLMVASALEPQRSLYRSYLGKAFADSVLFSVPSDADRAREELALARRLDPNDPTPWLYSALVRQQENRIRDATDDLRASMDRNDRRMLYRSRFGLDQDRAVRGANLANLYADAGFRDLAFREATRAVNADYANAAAHLFLANSYDALRDPRQILLRYETPWYGEFLLANLLAPVGAGSLSQAVAQNEYSRLLERDRFGIVNRTTWTGNGDWLQQAAQFGQSGNVAYALEGQYRSEQGQAANNDLEQRHLSLATKIQAGPDDGFFLHATLQDFEAGDVLPRYDPDATIPGLRLRERQEPLAHLGWNHEWRPGVQTLVLVSPWNASQEYTNPSNTVPWVLRNPAGQIEWAQTSVVPLEAYESRLTGVSLEAQQIWQLESHGWVAGLRYQLGGFDTSARLDAAAFAPDAPPDSATSPELERFGVYVYDHWRLARGVLLSAGISYDRLSQPRNFRTAPLTEGNEAMERWLPKIGLTVTPWNGGTLRAAWARSLGGVSFDQSFRLEPVQVAGFAQVFRGLIPEALVGSVAGQEMETLAWAWDQVYPTRTWTTLTLERRTSRADRELGGFVYGQNGIEEVTAFRQELDYAENALAVSAGQWIDANLAVTLGYRVSESSLDTGFPGLPTTVSPERDERSVLHQVSLGARYMHASGFFASWESAWTGQNLHDDASWMDGDSVWRHDLWAGWRFLRRKAEVAVGLLNLTDEDYHIYPLNEFAPSYRDRTVAVTGR